ncbi:MAG: glucose-1-phosphate cytidylyltransferase [Methanosphaera sp.]|nr:glucose-1-phosphate cytidylyltransferase [Methanosphaera sp.]
MQVGILAGGFGTRLSEETVNIPKPMVRIGEKPILWHIMKIYSKYGFDDFIIMLGYKGHLIKDYFANYFLYQSDVTIDLRKNKMEILNSNTEPWKITLVDTGLNSNTGHRVKQIEKYIEQDQFMLTYGDGVSDVNLNSLIDFHNSHDKIATLTAVQPSGRFGSLTISDDFSINGFNEKPKGDKRWVNGGFFVLDKDVFNYIDDDVDNNWEENVLSGLVDVNQLVAYKHYGFWQCMDTLREKTYLQQLVEKDNTPWLK